MRRTRVPIFAVLFLGASIQQSGAGEMIPFAQKVFGAELILEVHVSLKKPIPSGWPAKGREFPATIIDAAQSSAKVERVLVGESEELPAVPQPLFVFSNGSPCWWSAHEHGAVCTLVFLKRDDSGKPQPFFGVEHESGLYTDLNPDYERLVAAIVEAAAWNEERMMAVGVQMLWMREREVLRNSDNPYLLSLAVDFLRSHDAAAVIDEIWGARGSADRARHELQATVPVESVCHQ